MDREFRLFNVIFWVIFTTAAIMIVGSWGLMAFVAYKGYNGIDQKGIRGVIEQLWCGADKDCKLPSFLKD